MKQEEQRRRGPSVALYLPAQDLNLHRVQIDGDEMHRAMSFLHFCGVVKVGIHPLLWRPEIVGRTHHLCRSNRAEGAEPQREKETEDGSVRYH